MRIVVVAHRTCPQHCAENSLAGIARAAELGADAVEIDVRLTSDGVPVLMHDRTLRRTTGAWAPTWAHSFASLRKLRLPDGSAVPSFAEALHALPQGLRMAVELKTPRALQPVLGEIRNQNRQRDVMAWARRPSTVRLIATREPEVEPWLLRNTFTRRGHGAYLRAAHRSGARGISLRWEAVTPALAARARALGLTLYSWCRTPSVSPDKLALLDGLVSDWPAEARKAASEAAKR